MVDLHVCVVYLVRIFLKKKNKKTEYSFFYIYINTNAVESCVQDYRHRIASVVLTAYCEFHSLIFLFISEPKEAFFNKTTEKLVNGVLVYPLSHLSRLQLLP